MRYYRTIQGDNWDLISYRVYQTQGRELRTGDLLEANPDYRDYVIFPAGIVLNVPDIDITQIETLPPWKR